MNSTDDNLTVDDLDDKIHEAALELFGAIQFNTMVQHKRQLSKAEIVAEAIEWVNGIADTDEETFQQMWVDPALRKIQAGASDPLTGL
jgi:hypothetical protein